MHLAQQVRAIVLDGAQSRRGCSEIGMFGPGKVSSCQNLHAHDEHAAAKYPQAQSSEPRRLHIQAFLQWPKAVLTLSSPSSPAKG